MLRACFFVLEQLIHLWPPLTPWPHVRQAAFMRSLSKTFTLQRNNKRRKVHANAWTRQVRTSREQRAKLRSVVGVSMQTKHNVVNSHNTPSHLWHNVLNRYGSCWTKSVSQWSGWSWAEPPLRHYTMKWRQRRTSGSKDCYQIASLTRAWTKHWGSMETVSLTTRNIWRLSA